MPTVPGRRSHGPNSPTNKTIPHEFHAKTWSWRGIQYWGERSRDIARLFGEVRQQCWRGNLRSRIQGKVGIAVTILNIFFTSTHAAKAWNANFLKNADMWGSFKIVPDCMGLHRYLTRMQPGTHDFIGFDFSALTIGRPLNFSLYKCTGLDNCARSGAESCPKSGASGGAS